MATLASRSTATPPEEEEEDEARAPIYLHTTTSHNGQTATVARDAEGHVVYPTYVPPTTDAGLSPRSHQPSEAGPSRPEADALHAPTSRPSGMSKYASELPQPTKRRVSAVPAVLKRAGTNVSQVTPGLFHHHHHHNHGHHHHHNHHDDTSSSDLSSSSDEEDHDHHAMDHYRRFRVGNEHYRTRGKVSKRDGRLNISLKDTSNTGYLAKALGMAVKKVVAPADKEGDAKQGHHEDMPNVRRLSSASTTAAMDNISCPKLNIVIMVIGSRGDMQPFLKIGKVLKEQYGHRVRIATHPAFREFVEKDSGLEFFSVGGDPSELMAFMVKNPGMIPTLATVKAGDIGKRRAAMAEMFEGFWRACTRATDDEDDVQNIKMVGNKEPFVADAIIANPPSFAHIHCAEALGIPLHLMFTFPYTPTAAFPHPLASIKKSNVDPGYTNWISYPLVEMMVWQGLGDLVNDFRMKTLGLDPVSTLWAPGATYRLHVPFTYMWSPGLVPKPSDWGPEIDVSGFVFLELASSYTPPDDLAKFLDAGEPPVYIGFGSIVVDDANRFTEMIFEAVKLAGVRALVSKGWGGLGGDQMDVPEYIHLLDNVPHDWLFPRVRACVIHGGAGTTAIALKCGKPTMIVPFFGDQHFWGSMVGNAKAGPEPVPYKNLTAEKLAEGIRYCLTDEAVEAVGAIAKSIQLEGDGAENACQAFHHHLTLSGQNSMRCSLLEDRVAVWKLKKTNLRLSAMAAEILVDKGYLSWKKLRLIRHNEWNDFDGPGEPVTGIAGSVGRSIGNVFGGIGGIPFRISKAARKRREKQELKKRRHQEKKERKEKMKAAAKKTRSDASQGAQPNGHAPEPSQPADQQPYAHAIQATDHATRSQLTLPADPAAPDTHSNTPSRARMHRSDTAATVETTASTTADDEQPPGAHPHAHAHAAADAAEEAMHYIGSGALWSARALARAPIDLSMAVAQGFHNAPRLYGDDTVRRPPRVTGMHSGLRAAGHEFAYGVYDGFTGLVRLPVRGARAGGAKGFVKGVGMGLTGFVLKDIAALAAPVGYTLKGVAKQITRREQPVRLVRRARIVQGQREVAALGAAERAEVARRVARGWEVMRALWEALEKAGRRGRPLWRLYTRRVRGLGAPFESVEVAERVLAAVRRGEDVETVCGRVARRSDDGGRDGKGKVARDEHREVRAAAAKAAAAGGGGDATAAAAAGKVGEKKEGKEEEEKDAVVDIDVPDKPVAEVKKEESARAAGSEAADAVKTPAEEKDNPFSASLREMKANKQASWQEQERLAHVNSGAHC